MVKRITDNGTVYHEPPYTKEEEIDFYRRMSGGPITVLRGAPSPQPQTPQPSNKKK
jgi:hypothetical protein